MDIITLIKRHYETTATAIPYPYNFVHVDLLVLPTIGDTEEHLFDLLRIEIALEEGSVAQFLTAQSDIPPEIQSMEQEFNRIEAALSKVREAIEWTLERNTGQLDGLRLNDHWTKVVVQQEIVVRQSSIKAKQHFRAFRTVC